MNAPRGMSVDHINGNKLDNRKENLRVCTHAENSRNSLRPRSNNKSGLRGVSWSKPLKKWIAQITFEGEKMKIGYFSDKTSAHLAYQEASKKYFGKFSPYAK